MKTKNIVAVAALIAIILLMVFYPKNVQQIQQKDWEKYSNKNIGVEFEYPGGLFPFPSDEVYFAEDELGMGIINLKTEYTKVARPEDAIVSSDYPTPRIINEINIDGTRAIVTIPGSDDPDNTSDETIYFVRDNRLYRISARGIDVERFWKSIKFIDN